MKKIKLLVALLAVFAIVTLAGSTVFAQDTTGYISVAKFNDLNKDGVWDEGEPPIANWEFKLTHETLGSITGFTGTSGFSAFGGLPFGNWEVCEVMQEGWANSTPICVPVTLTGGDVVEPGPDEVVVTSGNGEGSYLIEFLGKNGNDWTYRVTEADGKDLSHWVLGLCEDVQIVGSDPDFSDVNTDPTTGLYGIKWDVNESFSSQEFVITVDKDYPIGTTPVAIKTGGQGGFDGQTGSGFIAGPHCGEAGNPGAELYFGNYEEGDTLVNLVGFEAETTASGVVLTWETAAEIDNAGFNVYRSKSPNGPFTKVNGAMIAAQGSPMEGFTYQFEDMPGSGIYFYKLEDVDTHGISTMHDPVQILMLAPFRSPMYRPQPPVSIQ